MVRVLSILLSLLFSSSSYGAQPSVIAKLDLEAAWVGQAIPLSITLYSPGPFSGTAVFDLPEIPRTFIVKVGNPVVGSEEIDDETWLTQQHEFMIFTQNSGRVEIPSFVVRFSGKKTFTSDPVSMNGQTEPLFFDSLRPPGTESLPILISPIRLEITQSWAPEQKSYLQGDVVTQTIKRTAEGSTAMMFPPISPNSNTEVRVYQGKSIVEDSVNRGEVEARRIDTIKYQLQSLGKVELPELKFTWWDTQSEKLRSSTLPGMTINVTESDVAKSMNGDTEELNTSISLIWTGFFLVFGMLIVYGFRNKILGYYHGVIKSEERLAKRDLKTACRKNDPVSAHSALMKLVALKRKNDDTNLKLFRADRQVSAESIEQWTLLVRPIFSTDFTAIWDGEGFWKQVSKILEEEVVNEHGRTKVLCDLN